MPAVSFRIEGSAMPGMQAEAIACLLVAMLTTSGCTTETWYYSAKNFAENNCRKQPSSSADDCFARLNNATYETYEKERAAIK